MRRVMPLVVLTLSLVHVTAFASADPQVPLGGVGLRGVVLDEMRMPIAAAHVTAVAEAEIVAASSVTDQRGTFLLAVRPGRYTLHVAADGFVEAERRVSLSETGNASTD